MKTIKPYGQALVSLTLLALCLLSSTLISAQTATPADAPVYVLREYMKVEPGQEANYLKVEQTWKKVHQRRVAEGKIISWGLSRRLFPSGTNAEYDYMTTTAFKSGKDMEAANSMTWDYIKQGMNPDEIAIAEGTEKTRKIVARTLDVVLERVEPTPAYWQTTYLTANAGQGAALEKMETMMKPVFMEATKMGKIASWRFGSHLYPIGPETGNYYRVIGTKNLDDMMNTYSNNYIETAFKKVYPTRDYAATMKAIRDMITIVKVDLWEGVEKTN